VPASRIRRKERGTIRIKKRKQLNEKQEKEKIKEKLGK
jgi:hypothetical protein